jgi:trimeric autotransporter adhesin
MTRASRLITFSVFALGGLLVAGGLAWAFWTGSGAGSASGAVNTLAPPTAVTAVPGSSTVSVSWVATSAPGGGPITGYYVQRLLGSTASPACGSSPSALLPTAATSCNDTSVSIGTYTYTVTAVLHSWTATSAPSSAVFVDPVDSFTVSAPASTTAGASFTVTVTAKDESSNTITGYVGTVHFASSDPGSPSLPIDYSFVAADNGTHAFTNGVTLNTAPNQTVTVNDTTEVGAMGTATVTVNPAAAAELAFTQQPSGGTSAIAWATQPKVTVQDAFGNTITSSSASVTLAITAGTGTSGALLTCTANPKAAVSGVASFAGCKIDKSGSGYTLNATATNLTTDVSNAFTITAGAATKVGYSQPPTAVVAGSAISPAVVAAVQDASGNTVTSSNATITVAITTNPGGGTLSGTLSVNASSGVATFADLSINKSGTGYKLTMTSPGLTSAVSATFNVTAGTAAQLAYTAQPSGGTGGVSWATQPKVAIQDTFGNTVTTSTANVTLAITSGTGTSGAVLTCTANPKAAVSGVASFAGCKIDKSGSGYTLTATSPGLTTTVSNAFNVTVGPATKLVYSQQPTTIVAGSTITPAVTATVQDAGNNTVTSSNATVTVAISTNPGGGTLSGTLSTTPSSGVVTFADLSIDKTGTGYKLTLSSTGLTSAVSNTFNVTVGAAAKVAFTQQPNGGAAGAVWSTQPKVTIQDAFGNTVTTSSANVTLTITSHTGTSGAVLTCTANPKAAASGIAAFAGCKINTAGSGYTLTATAAGLTSAVSSAFNIT